MAELILQVVLMASLTVMVLVAARAVPRVPEARAGHGAAVERWIRSLPLEQIDAFLHTALYKGLRRLRLLLLKIDNRIGRYLEKAKGANGGKNEKGSMDEFIGNGNGDNSGS